MGKIVVGVLVLAIGIYYVFTKIFGRASRGLDPFQTVARTKKQEEVRR